jgi:hypothetical protein
MRACRPGIAGPLCLIQHQERAMPSPKDLIMLGRRGLLVAALAAAAVLLAPLQAGATDRPAVQKPRCWVPAIVDGRHLQPAPKELAKCRPDAAPPAPAARSSIWGRPPIDADEAFILDVIRRYAAEP